MYKLQAFYKSGAWEKFRRVVISERTDQDGFVCCAICGKPIVNKKDLIVHHKQELTIANVADAFVALNPDNVECVHHACHNKLHNRWQGGNSGWKPKPRQVFIVYGSPCSGKTTWVNEHKTDNDLVVDIDSIYQAITGLPRYVKPGRLKGVVFRLRDELLDVVKHRSGKWQDAYIITGGALRGDRERLQQQTGATQLVFIEATKQECIERLGNRGFSEEMHNAWAGYIEEWFDKFQA